VPAATRTYHHHIRGRILQSCADLHVAKRPYLCLQSYILYMLARMRSYKFGWTKHQR